MNLPEEIASARSGAGLSQSALAARVGVARLAITRLEAGIGSMSLLLSVMRELDFRISGIARGSTLPAQLQARRVRLGFTPASAGKKAGLDARTVKDLEAGKGTLQSLTALLSAIAPRAKKSDPPRASWAYDHTAHAERDKRFTPAWFLDHITSSFGEIDLDPCAHELSAVEAARRIILPECGLAASWAGARLVYVNPPYSAVTTWMARAADAWDNREAQTILMLVPVRTDSPVFQARVSRDAEVLFLSGRMRFESPVGLAWPAPFSLMVIAWGAPEAALNKFIKRAPAVRMRPWRST